MSAVLLGNRSPGSYRSAQVWTTQQPLTRVASGAGAVGGSGGERRLLVEDPPVVDRVRRQQRVPTVEHAVRRGEVPAQAHVRRGQCAGQQEADLDQAEDLDAA